MEGVRQMRGTSVNQVKDAADLRRVEPGRHHDHALDLDPGALSDELPAARTDAAVAALLGCARATAGSRSSAAANAGMPGCRRAPSARVPRGRMGLDDGVRQGPRDLRG